MDLEVSNEEIKKIKVRNQVLESDNKILSQKIKEKEKDIKFIKELYQKERSKLFKIYEVVDSKKINEENYLRIIDWIKEVIKEGN